MSIAPSTVAIVASETDSNGTELITTICEEEASSSSTNAIPISSSRMILAPVIIPNSVGGSSFAQLIPAASSGNCSKIHQGTSQPAFQQVILTTTTSSGGPGVPTTSSQVLGLLTPVLSGPEKLQPTLVHKILPKPKISFKIQSHASASPREVKTLAPPPPLQPIGSSPHQIININKIIQSPGSQTEFKRIPQFAPRLISTNIDGTEHEIFCIPEDVSQNLTPAPAAKFIHLEQAVNKNTDEPGELSIKKLKPNAEGFMPQLKKYYNPKVKRVFIPNSKVKSELGDSSKQPEETRQDDIDSSKEVTISIVRDGSDETSNPPSEQFHSLTITEVPQRSLLLPANLREGNKSSVCSDDKTRKLEESKLAASPKENSQPKKVPTEVVGGNVEKIESNKESSPQDNLQHKDQASKSKDEEVEKKSGENVSNIKLAKVDKEKLVPRIFKGRPNILGGRLSKVVEAPPELPPPKATRRRKKGVPAAASAAAAALAAATAAADTTTPAVTTPSTTAVIAETVQTDKFPEHSEQVPTSSVIPVIAPVSLVECDLKTPSELSETDGKETLSSQTEDPSDEKDPVLDENLIQPLSEDFDPSKLLDWQDGVGVLPGSDLKFKVNEFGIMEMVDEEKMEEDSNKLMDFPRKLSKGLKLKKSNCDFKRRSDKRCKDKFSASDDIYCCENCGCYGMACEFKSPRFCGEACEEATIRRRAAIGRRATELEELRMKRRRRRQREVRQREKERMRLTLMQQKADKMSCLEQSSSNLETPDFPETLASAETSTTSAETSTAVAETPTIAETPTSTVQNSPNNTPDHSEVDESSENKNKPPLLPWQIPSCRGLPQFSWSKYLEHCKARAAPTKLFLDNGFPYQRNAFRAGMRLEGIDPRLPSQFCVLSVALVQGYRVKLHIDGWPSSHDFWVNADSKNIFAVGFCEKTQRSLVGPRGFPKNSFSWTTYLKSVHAGAAPRQLFVHRTNSKNSVGPSGFRVGMKLEAVDRQNNSLVCVATVADILDGRILIHFDSWDHTYDYWVEPNSPYIHPVGWCAQSGHTLTPPNGLGYQSNFSWETYLKETKSVAVPSRAFKPKPSPAFQKSMKLECVDPRFPEFIRVATVHDCKDHRINIVFDGWPMETSVWFDSDSTDIHPVGWCNKTGHPLSPPPGPGKELGCPWTDCRALLKNSQFILPHSSGSCPLSSVHLSKTKKINVRVEPLRPALDSSEGEDYKLDLDEDLDVQPPTKKMKLRHHEEKTGFKVLRSEVHESIFSPGYSPVPVAEPPPLNWTKHAELLNFNTKTLFSSGPVRKWSPQQVENFVQSLPGCEDKSKIFKEERIDGEAFLLLTQSDLIALLGFKVGPAIKLFSSIILLKQKKEI